MQTGPDNPSACQQRLLTCTSCVTCYPQVNTTTVIGLDVAREQKQCGTRVQPTVTFPIGDHVNVLHDYKKTRPSKILKLRTCRCHHLIDTLVEFSKNHIFLTLLKCLNVPYPSMFTNFSINYYAHSPCGENNCQKFFRLFKSSKNPQLHCQHVLPANLSKCLLKYSYAR